MQKGIKIKASLIILSWLINMAHNIIPHNHQENEFNIFQGHSHTGISLNDEYHSHNADHDVCRISSLLFHQISQDNLFIENSTNDDLSPELRKELIIYNNTYSLYSNSYYTSVSLRAPPAA